MWWIGIGHAGTFISAILLLLEQKWRTSINRFAEAMTLFAVLQAGLFPLLHLGRPWFFYWLIPYPATMRVWPNFRSALPWDAAAVFTYFTVSFLFWYVGLLPDLASIRDRAPTRRRRIIYGIFALGWRGSARQHAALSHCVRDPRRLRHAARHLRAFHREQRFRHLRCSPAGTPPFFPPLFVAGAILFGIRHGGDAAHPGAPRIPIWRTSSRESTPISIGKMLLVTAFIVIYSYIVEFFIAWYSGDPNDIYQYFVARPTAEGRIAFYIMLLGNVVTPQLLWSSRFRRSPLALWIASIAVNLGMWSERFVIIVQSLERDFLVSSWRGYRPTYVDWSIFFGTICFFILLFLTFLRFVPFIPLSEVKELKHELAEGDHA